MTLTVELNKRNKGKYLREFSDSYVVLDLETTGLDTNFLILGNNDYCTQIKEGKSNKQKRAEELILKGADLQILSESVFYEMIEDN